MAEVTGLRNNALPYPVYAAPWAVVFGIRDSAGDLVTGAAGLDSEVSLNGDTFADCTNEATEIGSTGMYYLLLTAAECTADVVAGMVKTSTVGAKTTPFALYPRKLPQIRANTAAGGAAGYITLDANASALDDRYNGMICIATIDGNVEARVISDYDGTTKQASVVPNWNVAPDSDDTFIMRLPDGIQRPASDVIAISGDSTAADNLEAMFDGTGYAGGTIKLGVDAVAISGDSTAADNLELAYDGTGYAGGTTKPQVDVVAISGDTTAADNLETMLDGTGGKVLSLGGLNIDASAGTGTDGNGTAVRMLANHTLGGDAVYVSGYRGMHVIGQVGDGAYITGERYGLHIHQASGDSPIYLDPPGQDFSTYLIASVADAVWDEALANRAVDTASTGGALNYIKGRVANLSPGSIAVQSPVLSSDSFEMIRGDSYNVTADYDRSITFSVTTPLSIMTTAAEVYGYFVYGTNMIVQQPTVTTTDTNVYDIKFEFTNEQTVLMTSGTWDIKVWWNTVTTEGDVTTLVSGTFTIVEPVYDGGDGADGVPAP